MCCCVFEASAAVSLTINGAHDKLFKQALDDIILTIDKARTRMRIGPEVVPDIGACFNLMLPAPFLTILLEAINRPNTSDDVPVNTGQLEDFFNIFLLLSRYRCSPTDFFSKLKHGTESQFGPHENHAVSENDFARCLHGLSFACNTEHRGNRWAESQTFDHTIADAAKGILSTASCIMYLLYLFNVYFQRILNHSCFNVRHYYIFSLNII